PGGRRWCRLTCRSFPSPPASSPTVPGPCRRAAAARPACRRPASCRQPLLHPMHGLPVEARDVVGGRQRLRIEELRQLVVLLGEAGEAVELVLQLQRLAPQRREELLDEIRAE